MKEVSRVMAPTNLPAMQLNNSSSSSSSRWNPAFWTTQWLKARSKTVGSISLTSPLKWVTLAILFKAATMWAGWETPKRTTPKMLFGHLATSDGSPSHRKTTSGKSQKRWLKLFGQLEKPNPRVNSNRKPGPRNSMTMIDPSLELSPKFRCSCNKDLLSTLTTRLFPPLSLR